MQYRKKPVVIEAIQMTEQNRLSNSEWPEWLHAAWNKDSAEVGAFYCISNVYVISTPEGSMVVSTNDWIIQCIKGELYPCEPDIFERTYEPVVG